MSGSEAAAANKDGKSYYKDEQGFLEAEWKRIAELRGYSDAEQEEHRENLVGLALSGGGIRSASFALGVLQSLAKQGVLGKVDYLSTVSGGGYIGSTLTWFLHKNGGDFPLGEIGRSRREDIKENRPAAILNFIRQHGNYLIPGQGLNLISLVAVVLRSVLLAFFVYFSLLVIALQILGALGFYRMPPAWIMDPLFGWLGMTIEFDLNWLLLGAGVLLAVLLLSFLLYSLATFRLPLSVIQWLRLNRYWLRIWAQRAMGWLAFLILLAAFLGSLPLVVDALTTRGEGSLFAGILGVISTALGASGTFASHFKGGKGGALGAVLGSNWYLAAVAGLLLYGILLFGYSVAEALGRQGEPIVEMGRGAWQVSFLLLVLALVTGFFVNLNYVSLHRMYRDRLMETFLPDPDKVKDNIWRPAYEANTSGLWTFAAKGTAAPYHLLNANVVLVDSEQAKYGGRGGDSFILSPLFCGSHATGWHRTDSYMRRGMFSGMTLPTAMAISGAAVNSDTGASGQGVTRNRLVSFLMTFLNIRLGYWAPNPQRPNWGIAPSFLFPGLKALRGKGMDETSLLVELTDGGHFDNIGLYELVRRRTKLIIVSDGTGDPKFTFSDFGNTIERLRVDFGVNIRFPDEDFDLRHIMPHSASIRKDDPSDKAFREKFPLAARGFAIGRIEYPGKRNSKEKDYGVIVYIKSTLTKALTADIYGYKSRYPEFPDQSTADQFFDETQIEAYRELGYRLSEGIPWDSVF